ncbi:protein TRIGALACTOSYLDIACYLGLYCEROL 4, chloroplastic [Andrographis paniculata]|uniref:protein TRIGALACTOSYLDIACYLGLYCEROL 4, chloroplastic n=1 Tax=Andrographis paniculata TaxID=175694 RepID=UPI0021E9AC8F|nr:protein TRIGALACTOSYLDIACYLGLYCEROL 4, chloroplastic [Andrographis paniculata]
MAKLRTAMDAAFWDLDISTPLVLDGVAKAVPGEPIPLDGARASKSLRIQQLAFLKNGFPLGILPSISPSPNRKEVGALALQSVLGPLGVQNWWVGLIGQIRPKKLISSIKAEVKSAEEWDLSLLKDAARHVLDKSLYAVGLTSQIALPTSTSILLSTESHGERNKRRTKASLFHKLPNHDITVEAAWPQLFIDQKGKYWDVPESISMDCASLVSDSGMRYRFGVHKTVGVPKSVDSYNTESLPGLLPGLCAKAAVSFEKAKEFWRIKETKEDCIIEVEDGQIWRPAYDIRLREPHAAISGIIGATCAAWLHGEKDDKKRRFGADLFSSVCYTFQHGKFREYYGDLTRVDARLDVNSFSALAEKASGLFRTEQQTNQARNELGSPKLNLIVQQQVAGPIVFRVDSKFSLGSSSGRNGPHLEDLIYSLSYSLRLLGSGKVVAWYSGKRKEGMIELRMLEF